MKGKQRLQVFGVGFILGCLLVSGILRNRHAKEDLAQKDLIERINKSNAKYPEIPEVVPSLIRNGVIRDYGEVAYGKETWVVWLVFHEENYPWVRIEVEKGSEPIKYRIMAADQFLVSFKDGVDRKVFGKTILKKGTHLREYFPKEKKQSIGLNDITVNSLPQMMELMRSFRDEVASVEFDLIRMKDE